MNIFVNIIYPISTHTSLEYILGKGTAKFIKYVALIFLILDNVKTFFKVLFSLNNTGLNCADLPKSLS